MPILKFLDILLFEFSALFLFVFFLCLLPAFFLPWQNTGKKYRFIFLLSFLSRNGIMLISQKQQRKKFCQIFSLGYYCCYLVLYNKSLINFSFLAAQTTTRKKIISKRITEKLCTAYVSDKQQRGKNIHPKPLIRGTNNVDGRNEILI